MFEVRPVDDVDPESPGWGVWHAAFVFVAAQIASIVGLLVFSGVRGIESQEELDNLSIADTALLQIPLWAGLIGGTVYVVRRWGSDLRRGLRLSTVPMDAPIGVGIGIACQLVLVPLVTLPFLVLFDIDSDRISEPARDLADRATGVGVLLLVVVVVVGAPVAEELFFRGLLLRALAARLSTPVAIGLSAVVFGASHWQLLQLPALIAFGVVLAALVHRSGRLALPMWAHVGFNASTIALLLAFD